MLIVLTLSGITLILLNINFNLEPIFYILIPTTTTELSNLLGINSITYFLIVDKIHFLFIFLFLYAIISYGVNKFYKRLCDEIGRHARLKTLSF